ncbi:MAG: MgtC/SapB family protein [Nautiliaceae bacterium]
MDIETLKSVFITIALGFLIGLERNISFKEENEKGFAGSRTFALISLLGFLSGYMENFYNNFIYVSFFGVITLVSIAYFLKVFHYHKQGTTTHISALITFIIGVLIYNKEILSAIIIATIIVLLLNIKTTLKNLESKLSSKDINAAILLLGMSFLILPYLPDKMIYYVNPHKTWLMAIIIASLSFIGYLGIKLFGEKYGIILTGAAGGFVSSTAVTYSLSKLYSKLQHKTAVYTYASAIAIANTIMFARVYIETLLINKQLAYILAFSYLFTTFIGVVISYRLYKKSPNEKINTTLIEKNPLEIEEAIKFAVIFAIIYALTYYIGTNYGNTGIYLISLISGLTDVDAITLSLSSLAKNKISLINAAIGISIASISNSLFKLSIVWLFGKKELAIILTKFFIVLLTGFIFSLLISLTFLK